MKKSSLVYDKRRRPSIADVQVQDWKRSKSEEESEDEEDERFLPVLKTPGGYLVPAKVYDIEKYKGPKSESRPDASEYCTFVDEYGDKYWIFDGVTQGDKYPLFNDDLMIVKGSCVEWPMIPQNTSLSMTRK